MKTDTFLNDNVEFPHEMFSGSEGQCQPPSVNYLKKLLLFQFILLYTHWNNVDELNVKGQEKPICVLRNISLIDTFQVLNVLYLNVGDVAFKETKDHSKWALTAAPGTYWVCISDINRTMSTLN